MIGNLKFNHGGILRKPLAVLGLAWLTATTPVHAVTIEVAVDLLPENIVEGETAIFTILASEPPTEDLEIGLHMTTWGDFVADELPTSVTLPAGLVTIPVEVQTVDDATIEDDGAVHLQIVPQENYVFQEFLSFTRVMVKDNDSDSE